MSKNDPISTRKFNARESPPGVPDNAIARLLCNSDSVILNSYPSALAGSVEMLLPFTKTIKPYVSYGSGATRS